MQALNYERWRKIVVQDVPCFMTIREVAKTGIVSEHYLRLMAAQKRLPGVYSGNRFKVNYGALVEQLEAESRKAVGAGE